MSLTERGEQLYSVHVAPDLAIVICSMTPKIKALCMWLYVCGCKHYIHAQRSEKDVEYPALLFSLLFFTLFL